MGLLHNLKYFIHLLVIFQCFLLSFFLLTQRNRRRLQNSLLAALLISLALSELVGVFAHFPDLRMFISHHLPQLLLLYFPFQYLYMPLFYLYILSLAQGDFVFRKRDIFHLIPFVFFSGLLFWVYRAGGQSISSLASMAIPAALHWPAALQVFRVVADLQFLLYAVLSLLVLRRYEAQIRSLFSDVGKINLGWLRFVTFGIIGWRALLVIDEVSWNTLGTTMGVVLYIAAELLLLVFLCVLVLKGMKHPIIFSGEPESAARTKYERTLLDDATKSALKLRLIQHMQQGRPYLDPSLSIKDLARQLSTSPHHLSQVINSCFSQNFFDFINSFRIEESKRRLDDNENGKKILHILYDVGFNSKSVFNTAFKKHTGMTASQYRRKPHTARTSPS